MVNSLLRVSVVLGLAGMAMGIVMGIKQDFLLVPAHTHLNLLGFVTLFLSGLYYRVVPEAGASTIAKVQNSMYTMYILAENAESKIAGDSPAKRPHAGPRIVRPLLMRIRAGSNSNKQ